MFLVHVVGLAYSVSVYSNWVLHSNVDTTVVLSNPLYCGVLYVTLAYNF